MKDSPMRPVTDPVTAENQFTPRYRNYILFILTGVYVFNFIDRQILVILQESIKQELGLSDTQLGLMSGFTFAIFYVSFGIPIARLADKGNRRNIITIAIIIWSGMTALSGRAMSFTQLLLARIGVGIGEAGGSPPAHSIISDLFPPAKRATALAIYSTGISIGVLIGFLAGGWIDQFFGWRTAFYVVGIPGILYALLLFFTVKEPPRGMVEKVKDTTVKHTMKDVFAILWKSQSFRFLSLGAGLTAYGAYTVSSWMAPFLSRVHGMESGEIGTWLSLIFGIGGGLGFFLGGYIGDKIGVTDQRRYLWMPAVCLLFAIPFSLYSYFGQNTILVMLALIIPSFCKSIYLAPCLSMTHGIVGLRMRALASAVLFFVLNIVGLGMGPTFTGMVSDALFPSIGIESLRWALTSALLSNIIAAYCFMRAAKTIRGELRQNV